MHTNSITGALPDGHETPISNSAADIVGMGFNPSSLPKVDAIKGLAAALISERLTLRDEGGKGAREASIAITKLQEASMFGVAAATADL